MAKDKESKALATLNADTLAADAKVGMGNVDATDIRPPAILLVQKSSDLSLMKDIKGQKPDMGQYFHSGKLEILDEFEVYLLYAAKNQYFDRREKNPAKANKWRYQTIGMMADDMSIFGMEFRHNQMFALTGLFGFATSNKRPYWSIKIRLESKILSNANGEWAIPVVRIVEEVKDLNLYSLLKNHAVPFDQMGQKVFAKTDGDADPDDPIEEVRRQQENNAAAPQSNEKHDENVEPKDIPF